VAGGLRLERKLPLLIGDHRRRGTGSGGSGVWWWRLGGSRDPASGWLGGQRVAVRAVLEMESVKEHRVSMWRDFDG
jgi:hypothetical protein